MDLKVNSIVHKPHHQDANSIVINFADSAGKGRIRFILHPDIKPRQTEVLVEQLSTIYEGNIYPQSREQMKKIIAGELERIYKTLELRPLLRVRTQATESSAVTVSRIIAADRQTNTYLECLAKHNGQRKSCSVSVRAKLNSKMRENLKELAVAIIADTAFAGFKEVRDGLEEIVELFRDLHEIEQVKDNRKGSISQLARVETKKDEVGNIFIYGPYVYSFNNMIICLVRLSEGSSPDFFYRAAKALGIHKDEIVSDTKARVLVQERANGFFDDIKFSLTKLLSASGKDFPKLEGKADGERYIGPEHRLLIVEAFREIPTPPPSDYFINSLVKSGR